MTARDDPLEQILDPAFTANLDSVRSTDLRRRRAAAKDAEDEVSLCRRVVHARLDVLGAELERRHADNGEEEGAEETIERLKDVLGRGAAGSRGARSRFSSRTLQGAVSSETLSSDFLARLPDMGDDEIRAAIVGLEEEERKTSELRQRLFSVIDLLESELLARYKSGAATPDDILRGGGL